MCYRADHVRDAVNHIEDAKIWVVIDKAHILRKKKKMKLKMIILVKIQNKNIDKNIGYFIV